MATLADYCVVASKTREEIEFDANGYRSLSIDTYKTAPWDIIGKEEREWFDKWFKHTIESPYGDILNSIIMFPVADGYAIYQVVKTSPRITLASVLYSDGYTVHDALIRGLKKDEIIEMIESLKKRNNRNK